MASYQTGGGTKVEVPPGSSGRQTITFSLAGGKFFEYYAATNPANGNFAANSLSNQVTAYISQLQAAISTTKDPARLSSLQTTLSQAQAALPLLSSGGPVARQIDEANAARTAIPPVDPEPAPPPPSAPPATTKPPSTNITSNAAPSTAPLKTSPQTPAAIAAAEAELENGPPLVTPSAVTNADLYTPASVRALEEEGAPLSVVDQAGLDALTADLANVEISVEGDILSAESQATEQDQANFAAKEDWRVRLSLAPESQYLYNDPEYAGILKPLKDTDGVIFPYTPQISVNYTASYEPVNIVHSNYKVYQYSNSAVEQVTITCDFTCQDTFEANYMLAVIHFFRSMTKMFYGQDENPKNGTPPPLCYIFGMGGYQFAAHPLAISGFSYNLPNDVDYIKTTSASPAGEPVPAKTTADASATRLSGTGVSKGGRGPGPKFNEGKGNEAVTWVPTRIQISVTCLPIMSRNAVSNEFSLRKYGSGDLVLGTRKLGGGMW